MLHVTDAAAPDREQRMAAVRHVLEEVGALDVPLVEVYNKCDRLTPDERRRLQEQDPAALCISALERRGIDELVETIASRLALDVRRVTLTFDPGNPADRERIARVYRHARVLVHETRDGRVSIVADMPRRLIAQLDRAGGKLFLMMKRLPPLARMACLALVLACACAPKTVPAADGVGAAVSRTSSRPSCPWCSPTARRRSLRLRGMDLPPGGGPGQCGARVLQRPQGGARVLSSRDRARVRRARAQGLERGAGGAVALRQGSEIAASGRRRRSSGVDRRSLVLKREPDALAAFEARRGRGSVARRRVASRRRASLPRRPGRTGQCTRRCRAQAGSTRRSARTRQPSPARRTSPFLYRELAGVERRKGDAATALDHFRKAVELDATDASSLVQIGELLDMRAAISVARQRPTSQRWRSSRTQTSQARVDDASAPERMPPACQPSTARSQIAAQLTRADLAALIGVRLAPLLVPDPRSGRRGDHRHPQSMGGRPGLSRSHERASWIRSRTTRSSRGPSVRRVELAQTVARLLARIAVVKPARRECLERRAAEVCRSGAEPPGLSGGLRIDRVRSDAAGPDGAFQPQQGRERRRGDRGDPPARGVGGSAEHAREGPA